MKKDSTIITSVGMMIYIVSIGITLIILGIYPEYNWLGSAFLAMGIGLGIALIGTFSPW